MFDYDSLCALRMEVDKLQSAGQVPIGKAYALMEAFDEYLATVMPTGYEITYNPIDLYQVIYCENGERQSHKGWVLGLSTYNKATQVQWAMMTAYETGRHDKGGNDSVF